MIIIPILVTLILCPITLAGPPQTRRVVVKVVQRNQKPAVGVHIKAKRIGNVSLPTDQNGHTWLLVPNNTKAGDPLEIELANRRGQNWVLLSPPDNIITIRESSISGPIMVVRRGDPYLLSDQQVLHATAVRMLRTIRPSKIRQFLSPAQVRGVLIAEAKRLGKEPNDLSIALEKATDPSQQVAAAIFNNRYRDATRILTPRWQRTAERTFDLSIQLGFSLYAEGRYRDAAEKYELALAIQPQNYKVLNDLGLLRIYLAQFAAAERLLNQSLVVMSSQLEPNHPDVAATLSNMGDLYREQHRFKEAEEMYARSQRILFARYGKDSIRTYSTYNDYGALFYEQEKFSLAKENFGKALRLLNLSRNPRYDYDRLVVLMNRASAQRNAGEYAQSSIDFKDALKLAHKLVRLRRIDENHPIIGNLHSQYHGLFEQQQKFDLAEEQIVLAEKSLGKSLGKSHPEYALVIGNLGSVYFNTGRPRLAEPLLKEALRILEETFGSGHLKVADALARLANANLSLGQFSDAEARFDRARVILEENRVGHERALASIYNSLGGVYIRTRRASLAEASFLKAIRIWELHPGEVTKHSLGLINLGSLYLAQQRFGEAEPVLLRALDLRDKPGRPSQAIIEALAFAGGLFFVQKKYETALPYWERALRLADQPTENRALLGLLAQSLNNLGALYLALGKLTEAEPVLKRAYDLWPQLELGNTARMLSTSERYEQVLRRLGKTAEAAVVLDRIEQIKKSPNILP